MKLETNNRASFYSAFHIQGFMDSRRRWGPQESKEAKSMLLVFRMVRNKCDDISNMGPRCECAWHSWRLFVHRADGVKDTHGANVCAKKTKIEGKERGKKCTEYT